MSPRATQHLLLASQGRAMIQGREFVIPEDVVAMAKVVLRHRLVISPEARMESKTTDQVIDGILSRVPLPSGF
jgi:MoxR-like ATPase